MRQLPGQNQWSTEHGAVALPIGIPVISHEGCRERVSECLVLVLTLSPRMLLVFLYNTCVCMLSEPHHALASCQHIVRKAPHRWIGWCYHAYFHCFIWHPQTHMHKLAYAHCSCLHSGVSRCDARRSLAETKQQFPGVDFSRIQSEEDTMYPRFYQQNDRGYGGEPEDHVTKRGLAFLSWLMNRCISNVYECLATLHKPSCVLSQAVVWLMGVAGILDGNVVYRTCCT